MSVKHLYFAVATASLPASAHQDFAAEVGRQCFVNSINCGPALDRPLLLQAGLYTDES